MRGFLRFIAQLLKLAILAYLFIPILIMTTALRRKSVAIKLIGLGMATCILILPIIFVVNRVRILTPSIGNLPIKPMSVEAVEMRRPQDSASVLGVEGRVSAHIISIVNGDTLDVQIDGSAQRLQLLGIDAPESDVCFGAQAAQRTQELLQGADVMIEGDPTQTNRDKYGRLNRYVWLSDGRFVNRILVEEGYAFEFTYVVPPKYQAEFRSLEQSARTEQRGLWATDGCNGQGRRLSLPPIESVQMAMPSNLQEVPVTKIVDGDTIWIDLDGKSEPVRFIGIDTPESNACYNTEATSYLDGLLKDRRVLIEAETGQGNRDKFNRLLRYLWLPDGRSVNFLMVANGYAYEYTYQTRYKYIAEFTVAEAYAHRSGFGLWAAITCDGKAGRRFGRNPY